MSQDQESVMKYQEKNEYFMRKALEEATKAAAIEEVPVGAVIVKNGEIIAAKHNLKETKKSVHCHAEILAIEEASQKLGSWRLNDCDIYVTLEPCAMCAGAIIQSRLNKVIYGTKDLKAGAVESIIRMFEYPWNHVVKVESGILQEECEQILKDFFKKLRYK